MGISLGRPSDLSYSIPVWGITNPFTGGTTYPPGGQLWSGGPLRVQPPLTYYSPGEGAAAQGVNWLFGNFFDVDTNAKTAIQALLDLTGHLPALNLTLRATSTHPLKRAFYSQRELAWFAIGDGAVDQLDVSLDYGRVWTSLTGSLGAAITLMDVAADTAGNVAIIAAGSRTVYKGAFNSYNNHTWTNTPNALTAAPSGGALDYDATAGVFIAVYRVGASGHSCDTSSAINAAWTPHAANLPSTFTSYTGTNNPVVTAIPGHAIAAFVDASATPKYNIAFSSNGGALWSGSQITPSIPQGALAANNVITKPTYDAVNAVWYFAVSSTSGARQTEVWKSPDHGVNWSQAMFFTGKDMVLHDLQAIGALLVGINDDGRYVYSVDAGVTWKWSTAIATTSSRLYMRSGGGGQLVFSSADSTIYPSHRIANLGLAVT